MTTFLSGFVSLTGCPNVGKSTLLNRLIGQKAAIVSEKAQTTRNRITGILTTEAYQLIFLDTPGVTNPENRLGEYMRKTAYSALDEVDVIAFIVDPVNGPRERDQALKERIRRAKAPCVGIVNKADIAPPARIEAARAFLADVCKETAVISAKTGEGMDALIDLLKGFMTEGPQYFPGDLFTDQPERVLVAEYIREQALAFLSEEVPHGIGVEVDKMSIRPDGELTDIYATIYCERESHKGIIIGKRGAMLKKIGEQARTGMELMLGTRVNLQLYVKTREGWRDKQLALKELGYD